MPDHRLRAFFSPGLWPCVLGGHRGGQTDGAGLASRMPQPTPRGSQVTGHRVLGGGHLTTPRGLGPEGLPHLEPTHSPEECRNAGNEYLWRRVHGPSQQEQSPQVHLRAVWCSGPSQPQPSGTTSHPTHLRSQHLVGGLPALHRRLRLSCRIGPAAGEGVLLRLPPHTHWSLRQAQG